MEWKTVEPQDLGLEYQKDNGKITFVILDVAGKRIKVTGNWDSVSLLEEKKVTHKVWKLAIYCNTEFYKEEIFSKSFKTQDEAIEYKGGMDIGYDCFRVEIKEVEEEIQPASLPTDSK